MDRARCTQTDPELFFPEQGSPGAEAKRICRQCPVRPDCLAYALASTDRLPGIWGGTAESERRELRRGLRTAA
jgi:WhiB family redox-sensing transcriptional regulator